MVVAVPVVVGALPFVPEQRGVQDHDVEQLREGQDDHERLQHPEPPPAVPAQVDLLARQPGRQRRDRPCHQRRRRARGEAVATRGAHVVDAGQLGGGAHDAGQDGEDEEVEGGAVGGDAGAGRGRAVDEVVQVPAREADDDDVHDEVQDQQRRHHVPASPRHC
ncbi:unnamed protein product [Alopecurus aequalis]